MIIVSQNKDVIINFERVNFIKIEPDQNEFDIEINYGEDYWDVIGTYDSYEKAKEVLKEIVKEYKRVLTTFNKGNGQQRFYNIPKVYYMPEK